MGDYRQLLVWRRAHAFTLNVYQSTRSFPPAEQFGLTSQLRRAAISIVSNIAEGSGRRADRDHARFLSIARGSTCEVECQLLLSRDVGYLNEDAWESLDGECRGIGRMLTGLILALRGRGPLR
jgi:four helix bundle protein